MNCKNKYKKYKNIKIGGSFEILPEEDIISNYYKIDSKGTQNCGIYLNKEVEKNNEILICNNRPLSDEIFKFLALPDNNSYPRLYNKFMTNNAEETKYYYLWEKMDGDLRDLFLVEIPKQVVLEIYKENQSSSSFKQPVNVYIDVLLEFFKKKVILK